MTPDQNDGRKETAIRRGLAVRYGRAIEALMPLNAEIVQQLIQQETDRFGDKKYGVELAVTYVKMAYGRKWWIFPSIEVQLASDDTITTYKMPFDRREEKEPVVTESSIFQCTGFWEETGRVSHTPGSPLFSQVYPIAESMVTHPDIQYVVKAFGDDMFTTRVAATLGEEYIEKVTVSSLIRDEEFIRR